MIVVYLPLLALAFVIGGAIGYVKYQDAKPPPRVVVKYCDVDPATGRCPLPEGARILPAPEEAERSSAPLSSENH